MGLQLAYIIAGLAAFGLVWFFTVRSPEQRRRKTLNVDGGSTDSAGVSRQSAEDVGSDESEKFSEQEFHLDLTGESSGEKDSGGLFEKGDAEDLPELDYQIEFVARLPGSKPVLRDEVLRIYRDYQTKLSKSTQIYGKDASAGIWTELEKQDETAQFLDLGATIQLADRRGPISEHELNRFSQMMLTMGEAFGRSFRFSMDFDDALQQSAMLDSIGRKFDAIAVLNLVSKRRPGFTWRDFTSCMDDLSLNRSANGVYVKSRPGKPDERRPLYSISPTDSSGNISQQSDKQPIHDIVLYMNVPATVNPEKTFEMMVNDAIQLQAWLEAKMVDHKGHTMSNKTLAAISEQVESISRAMAQEGLKPGSPLTNRLF